MKFGMLIQIAGDPDCNNSLVMVGMSEMWWK
jgi:hypothetical protein